ncbi:hypothetical protein GCM10027446_20320 [Angustibacter peucedani]
MRGPGEEQRRSSAVLLSAGAVASLAVLVVAQVAPEVSVAFASAFSGLLAIGTGAVVAADTTGRHRTTRRAAQLMGVAMVVWGVGQVLVGWAAAVGGAVFPTLGDQVSSAAAPIGVAGLLLAMRPSSLRTHWLRMTLDSLLLGSATGLLLWEVSFRSVLFEGGLSAGDAFAVGIVVFEITMVALLLLSWLRDLDRGLLLMMLGFALYTVADQYTLHSTVQGFLWPWGAAALSCLAWPVIGDGILRFTPASSDDEGKASETRVAVTTTTVSLGTLCGGVLGIAHHGSIDSVTVVISLLVIVVFGLRELHAGLQRGRLLSRLTRHAFHDPLTGLGNRRSMTGRLSRLDDDHRGAVLTLDLDGFKEVNDLLGHSRGDDLLVSVSRNLTGCLPDDCDAYRVGGDEFLVLVPGAAERGEQVADQLLVAVRRAAEALPGGTAVKVSASVGVSRWDAGDDVRGDVREWAFGVVLESGVALHAAKESGRDRVELYDGPVAARHRRAQEVERRLRVAVAEQSLEVHYQPVVDVDSGRVVGCEALARWHDGELGRVGPDEFIPVAERSGLVVALGAQVMDRALRDLVSVQRVLPSLRVAVNVSPVQLRSASFAEEVLALLERHGVAPDRLVVEVTESVFVGEDDAGLRHLFELRRQGVHVAIDDFGSGYSSLTYLSRLPASMIKVDQSLTAHVATDSRARAVLRAVVELGRSLPMVVAVEGIETAEAHAVVAELGGCRGQGWLYSAAVPLDELPGVVAGLDGASSLSA